jgi:hypothetical protein
MKKKTNKPHPDAMLPECDRLISAKPALASDYELGSISLYRNAKRKGVVV